MYLLFVILSCTQPEVLKEGDLPGECIDGADNDADGLYDCKDTDCIETDDCIDYLPPNQSRDLTLDYGQSEADIVLMSPLYTIPPYSDSENCSFMTYTGPDMVFTRGVGYQHPEVGHHSVILAGEPGISYDMSNNGYDCYEAMVGKQWYPIVELVGELGPGIGYGDYPEGMGYQILSGTTIMMQSHHVNPTSDSIIVNDRFDLTILPPDEVDYMAAPIEVGDDFFEIPPGYFEYTFECAFTESFNLAWISGHMHEWGASQYIDLVKPDEVIRIYGVDNWLEEYYFVSPIESFLPNGLEVNAGDKFRITCAWDNDTEDILKWPDEMCYSMGIIYPHTIGIICNP